MVTIKYLEPLTYPMHILIIDDDQEDLEIFAEAVASVKASVKCLQVTDGVKAMQMLEELTVLPEFIFLDINMPGTNGKEFLLMLKQDATLRDIPVVMYSTTSDTREIMDCLALGAYYFMIKPSSFKKLIDGLESIFTAQIPRGFVIGKDAN